MAAPPPRDERYYRQLVDAQQLVRQQLAENQYAELYKYRYLGLAQQPATVDVATDTIICWDGRRITREELEEMYSQRREPEPPKPKEPEDPAALRFTKLELD